ncbi:pyocin S6 family toxin immunity protein [Pseudomonas sp. R37(2017)]|uniref:pyocin S6 family toxin immunity protein n=1 Tax=Pseudomonas sp. R37(2017) TaxID=1981685 RepID=UPI000A1FDDA9|nr:pyocin S6 family toxin immunity protein [Pseudomonas sp. R37(2017)]
MHICISGFLLDTSEDDSLKFELDLDSSLNEEIATLLGHKSLNAMAEGEWLMSSEQIAQVSKAIGQSLPTHLQLYIGLEQ